MDSKTTSTTDASDLAAHYDFLLHNSPHAIAQVAGPSHIVRQINPAFCRLAGKPSAEILGRSFSNALPISSLLKCLPLLDRVYATRKSETVLDHDQSESATTSWSYSAWPVIGAEDHPAGLVIQITDATDSVAYRKQFREMNTSLLESSLSQHERNESAHRELQTLADNSPDVIGRLDHQLRFVFISRAITRLTGKPISDFLGKTLENVVHSRDQCERWSACCRKVFLTGQPQEIEFNLATPVGLRYFTARAGPEFSPDRAVNSIVFVAREITEHRRAEVAARVGELQFHLLADSISQLAWIAGSDGSPFWFNKRWHDYTGANTEQMQNRHWLFFHDQQHLSATTQKWDEAISGGHAFEMEHTLRSGSNNYRWFLTRVMPVRNEQGSIVRWFGTCTDVNQTHEVIHSNARLAAIVESSDDAIISADLDGIIETWNAGAQRLLGYAVDEVIGEPTTILVPTDRLREEDVILERLVRGEHIDAFDTIRLTKDNRHLAVSLVISPLKDSRGRVIGTCKILRPVIEGKRPEKTLHPAAPVRILLVEDHADTANVTGFLLEMRGHHVQIASDIAGALDAANHDNFDVVVSDLGLPDGSGLELMPQLMAAHQKLRGIALSGYSAEDDLQKCRQAGFSEHVKKPFIIEQLLEAIERVAGL